MTGPSTAANTRPTGCASDEPEAVDGPWGRPAATGRPYPSLIAAGMQSPFDPGEVLVACDGSLAEVTV